jgi:hypothetical protein
MYLAVLSNAGNKFKLIDSTMTHRYDHGSVVYVVRACYNDDAADLVAIGGEHSVDVLQIVGLHTSATRRWLMPSNSDRYGLL